MVLQAYYITPAWKDEQDRFSIQLFGADGYEKWGVLWEQDGDRIGHSGTFCPSCYKRRLDLIPKKEKKETFIERIKKWMKKESIGKRSGEKR